jgi:hypothetical protein
MELDGREHGQAWHCDADVSACLVSALNHLEFGISLGGMWSIDQSAVAIGCRPIPSIEFLADGTVVFPFDHCAIRLTFSAGETKFAELEGTPGSNISIVTTTGADLLQNGSLFSSWQTVAFGSGYVDALWAEVEASQAYYFNNPTQYSFWPWANSNHWVTQMLAGVGLSSTLPIRTSGLAPDLGWPPN